jgi:chromosome partitioning protein
VEEAWSLHDGLRAYAVLNCADPGTTSADNADAAAPLAEHPQLAHLDAPVQRRKAFANTVGQGLSMGELAPRDPKACEEQAALVRTVFGMQDRAISQSR